MDGGERAMIPRLGGLVVTLASTCETDRAIYEYLL